MGLGGGGGEFGGEVGGEDGSASAFGEEGVKWWTGERDGCSGEKGGNSLGGREWGQSTVFKGSGGGLKVGLGGGGVEFRGEGDGGPDPVQCSGEWGGELSVGLDPGLW